MSRRALVGKRTDGRSVKKNRKLCGSLEAMEPRRLFAAHIVGNTASFATIQAAVNAAAPGATINVDAGTYNETVLVNETLTINGANAGVDSRGTRGAESIVYATQTVFKITASDVTINGFTIEGDDADIGSLQGAGVLMAPSIHGTHVLNNIIQNNVTGIYLSNNSNTDAALIQHNLIQNNFEANNNWQTKQENGSRGIYTDGTVSGGYLTNVLIDSNTIFNSNFNAGDEDMGIVALQALTAGKQFNITISNNYWGGDSKALLATNVTNLNIIGNTITGTTDGSSGPVRFEGDANNVNIQYNTITGNGGPGVAVDDSGAPGDNSGFVINNNNIYGNAENIGFITQSSLYDGTVIAQNDWWGSTTGPAGDGPGSGSAVWANGVSGHFTTPVGEPGGSITFSPWATALINIASIPVPAAPTSLSATAASSTTVNLSWTAAMSSSTSELIQRSTDGVTFTTVAVVPALLNSYTDTGLVTGQKYFYRVLGSNSTGNSAASNVTNVTPPAYQPPVAPTGLTVVGATATNVSLTWTAPSSTFGVVGYDIYRNGALVGTSTTSNFTDTTVAPGTTYSYAVTTLDNINAQSAQSPAVSATTLALGTGLQGTYYKDINLGSAVVTEIDPTINFAWNGSSPATNVPGTNFSAKWVGEVVAPTSETYTFATTSDDGTRLWVNGQELVNDWTLHGATVDQGSITLVAGHAYAIELDYFQQTGDAVMSLAWSTPTIAQQIVPQVDLYPLLLAPSSLNAAPGTGKITLNWTDNASPITTGFTIQRSTDGVTFANVGTTATGVTTYTDSTVVAGTNYTYRVLATGDGLTSIPSASTTINTQATTTPLSALTWVSATAGWQTPLNNLSVAGNTLKLHGVSYSTGVGTHAVSQIVYNLGGAYTTFQSDIGIDDEELTKGIGSVDFQVLGDGKVLFDSGVLTTNSATMHVAVSVAGVQTLTLIANNGVAGSIDYDHADWAGAVLLANPTAPAAPTNLVATAISSSAITLTWAENTPTTSGFTVQRSTDGVTFATIGTTAGNVLTYTDSTAAASTKYYYQVLASGSGFTSKASPVASATTLSGSSLSTNLSSLNWVSATAGYASVQKNASILGNPITLKGVVYASGIGTHASSTIVYNVAGGYTNFLATVGIDDEELTKGTGSVDFQVLGDGKVLFDSGVLTNASAAVNINVSLVGVQTLTLIANNGIPNNIDYDHADWAGARLLSTPQVPSSPTALIAVTTSISQINLSWATPVGTAAAGYLVQRSTDGTNFTTIATLGAVNTYFDKTGLAAGVTYTYRILATNTVGSSSPSATAVATTLSSSAVVTNLSSLAWVSATTGYGNVQTDSSVGGNTLTLRGVTYTTGIGTHAVSNIVYNLKGAYTNFLSDVGIDDEELTKGIGSVDFQVIGDGKVLFDSGILTNSSSIVSLNVNVTGVQQLTLLATNGVANSIDYDHADWAGARLASIGAAPAAVVASELAPRSTISSVNIMDLGTQTATAWSNTLIGNVGQIGSALEEGSSITINGAGAGIVGKADAADYAYESLAGDGTIIAHLNTAQTGTDEAGLMVRDSLDAGSKEVALLLGENTVKFVERAKTDGVAKTTVTKIKANAVVPSWVKLVRKGNTFTAYDSVDGLHWKKVGATTIKMNSSVDIGLAGASGTTNSLSLAVFSNVAVTEAGPTIQATAAEKKKK